MSQSVSQEIRKFSKPSESGKLLAIARPAFRLFSRQPLRACRFRKASQNSSDASPAPKNSTVTVNDGRGIDRPKLIRVSELWGNQTPAVQEKYGQTAGEVMPAIADDYQFSIRLRGRDDCYSAEARIDVRVTDNEVWLCETVDLRMEMIDRDRHDFVRASIRAAVSEHLDNKLDIVETEGNVHKRRRLRLEVRFLDNYDGVQSEIYPITVRPGSGRADAATLYLNSSPKMIAHEMAHRMLAAVDEYEDSESRTRAPLRRLAYEGIEKGSLTGPQPSLMNDHEVGVLLPRHGLAIAGILRHATDSGGEQTKFSVAFSLDVEDETSENFIWKRSYPDLSLLDYQFENVHKFLEVGPYIQGEVNLLRLLVLAETFKGRAGQNSCTR